MSNEIGIPAMDIAGGEQGSRVIDMPSPLEFTFDLIWAKQTRREGLAELDRQWNSNIAQHSEPYTDDQKRAMDLLYQFFVECVEKGFKDRSSAQLNAFMGHMGHA